MGQINYTLYHGTSASSADNIMKHNFQIKKSRSDHWLGNGIYFYDDYENAYLWAKKKFKLKNTSIIIAYTDIDNVFDLDRKSNYNTFMRYTDEIMLDMELNGVNTGDMNNLEVRCLIFDCFKKIAEIKAIAYTFNLDLQFGKGKNKFLRLGKNEKQICVYDISILKNIRVYNSFDEEDFV